jgi:hypothetical protein
MSYSSYYDLFDQTSKERERIIKRTSHATCPHDFPPQLKHMWENDLEFCLTPIQVGFMRLDEKKNRNK